MCSYNGLTSKLHNKKYFLKFVTYLSIVQSICLYISFWIPKLNMDPQYIYLPKFFQDQTIIHFRLDLQKKLLAKIFYTN